MKRLFSRIVVFGILGLVTTVLVAWAFAMRTDWRGGARWNFADGRSMLEFDAPQQHTIWLLSLVMETGAWQITARNKGLEPPEGFGQFQVERAAENWEVPSWSVMRRGDPQGIFDATFLDEGFGYPFLSMTQRHRWMLPSGVRQIDGLAVPHGFAMFGRGETVPRRFIWSGAAIDTAIFGWSWFVILSFPGITIRIIRRRRGACPACGYDLRHVAHAQCPECGKATAEGGNHG